MKKILVIVIVLVVTFVALRYLFLGDKTQLVETYQSFSESEVTDNTDNEQIAGFEVTGSAMEPNYNRYQIAGTSTIDRALRRGDVIVFEYPLNRKNRFIKRIVGLPGDSIKVLDGKLYINDWEENGNYEIIGPTDNANGFTGAIMGTDEYFVIGDNRQASSDSRMWGPLNEEHIIWFVVD